MAWSRRRRVAPRRTWAKPRMMWIRSNQISVTSGTAVRLVLASDWELTAGSGIERGCTVLGGVIHYQVFVASQFGVSNALFAVHKTDGSQGISTAYTTVWQQDDVLFGGDLFAQANWAGVLQAGPAMQFGGVFRWKTKRKMTSADEIRFISNVDCYITPQVLLAVR
jgi:hypothetical protein